MNSTSPVTTSRICISTSQQAQSQPPRDLSVFVHLLDAGGMIIAQGDQSAPVYGHYPLTLWQAGEVVRDIYPLPRRGCCADLLRDVSSGSRGFVCE
ncbi:MAG: hypothetical protein U0694_06265 [Anaerolineae bacterium]